MQHTLKIAVLLPRIELVPKSQVHSQPNNPEKPHLYFPLFSRNRTKCLIVSLVFFFFLVIYWYSSWSHGKWNIFNRETWNLNRCQIGKVSILLRIQGEDTACDSLFRQMRVAWTNDANLIMFCEMTHHSLTLHWIHHAMFSFYRKLTIRNWRHHLLHHMCLP